MEEAVRCRGDEESAEGARELASEEGIFAGITTGANLAVALRLLAGPERGNSVAIALSCSINVAAS